MDSTWVRNYEGKPEVVLFGRCYNDRTRTVKTRISGFEPYFYVPAAIRPGDRSLPVWHRITEELHTDALGRSVRRAYTKLPSDVPKCREYYEFTDEADILFDKRYVVDNGIKYAYTSELKPVEVEDIVTPRIAFFDIEVKSLDGSMPVPETALHPIVSIQVLDSYTNEIIIFTNEMPYAASDQAVCSSEEDLLERFAAYIGKLDFDVLCGWYSNKFDLPYIIRRAQALNVDISAMTRLGRQPDATKNKNGWFLRITGRQCFDFYEAFKKYYAPKGQLEAYGLKDVISNVAVMKGAAYSYHDYGGDVVELFQKEDWETFLQYCRNDVIALKNIDDELKLVDFFEGIRKVAGVKLEETLMNSRVVEAIIMRDGIKPMPTKNYSDRGADTTFEGAIVMTPPIGIHNDVGVVDLASLYPTIMVGFDISPDVDHVIAHAIRTIMNEREKLRAFNKTNAASDVSRNKEQVMKYLANSFYGVIGWPKFRLYNVEQAGQVTRIGRELNEYLQSLVAEFGYTALYGDTDSVFVGGVTSVENGIALQDKLNERLAQWSKERGSSVNFELKIEKIYRRLLFKQKTGGEVAKKRYAGHLVWKDGEVKNELSATGLETKRSDQSAITKGLLKNFLNKCLLEDNMEGAIRDIKDVIKQVRMGDVSVHDVSIPRGVNNAALDNPWTRGMHNLHTLLGVHLSEGAKPRLIYLKGDVTELCIDNNIDEQMILNTVVVNWDMCCEKTVVHKMRTFVESIGYSWNNMIEGQQQFDL